MATNYNTYLDLAYLQYLAEEELETQRRIVLARNMFEGWLSDKLVDEIKAALLSEDATGVVSLINLTQTAVSEIADRLTIADLVDEAGNSVLWAMKWWQKNDMDENQHDLFEDTLVDAESFVMLVPSGVDGELRLKPRLHTRYTSAEVEGDNQGMKAHYPENDMSDEPLEFSKRWIETWRDAQGKRHTRQRMTLYVAGDEVTLPTVQKYKLDGGIWVAHRDEQDNAWPILWTSDYTEAGEPLPLPVIHFKNQKLRQETRKIQGIQVIVDNLITALTLAGGITAAPPLIAMGIYPTTDNEKPKADGSNMMKFGPRAVLGSAAKTPDQAKLEYMKPPDLSQLVRAITEIIDLAAVTAVIPSLMARKSGSGQTAAESLKQLDIRPIALTRKKQTIIGNGITRLFDVLVQLHRGLGTDEEIPAEFNGRIYARWLPADVRGTDVIDGTEEQELNDETTTSSPGQTSAASGNESARSETN